MIAYQKAAMAMAALALGACVCGSGGAGAATNAGIDPGSFVRSVDNPWFPLKTGSVWRYTGVKDGKRSRDVVSVTGATRTILGVTATAVSDRLYLAGKLAERTTDWYAQDRRGNVWYLGEATAELDSHGRVKTTEGSWQAGVDGAEAGIFMPARPRVGQSFRQEYYKGHAEDHFRVVRLNASVKLPSGKRHRALFTREWTPLEPGVIDHKYYVRGIGLVLEQNVKGGDERNALRSFHVRERGVAAPAEPP